MPSPIKIKEDIQSKFYIAQFEIKSISSYTYYIESKNQAAIVDPCRDIDYLMDYAKSRNSQITQVYQTHVHADYVSGGYELANRCKANLIFGPDLGKIFEGSAKNVVIEAKDQQKFQLGDLEIEVQHTPGHTLESSCFVVYEGQKQYCAFTGDTLFINDVGRPDLGALLRPDQCPVEKMAELLFLSLQNKIKKWLKDIIIFPAHGAGSPCGSASIGTLQQDTLDNQLKVNILLMENNKEKFCQDLLAKLPCPLEYFANIATKNRFLLADVDEVATKALKNIIDVEDFEKDIKNWVVLDTRDPEILVQGFIQDTVSVPIKNANYETWVGQLIKPQQKVLLFANEGFERESIIRLARVGLENVYGILRGGYAAWKQPRKDGSKRPEKTAKTITIEEVKKLDVNNILILDVRKPAEIEKIAIKNAVCVPLNQLDKKLSENQNLLPKDKDIYILCRTGYRSCVGLSILSKHNYTKLINLTGGVLEMEKQNFELLIKK